jgi:hypothetical protein
LIDTGKQNAEVISDKGTANFQHLLVKLKYHSVELTAIRDFI